MAHVDSWMEIWIYTSDGHSRVKKLEFLNKGFI